MISGYNFFCMGKSSFTFNTDFLRTLIKKKNGSIVAFAKDITSYGYPVTRQAVQLWLIGRKPCVDALLYLSEYFNEPIKKFLIKSDMASYTNYLGSEVSGDSNE